MKLRVTLHNPRTLLCGLLAFAFALSACAPVAPLLIMEDEASQPTPTVLAVPVPPTRPAYNPGELVDYTAQTGDTVQTLAVRFNTTEREIREANPIIPQDSTTMPPGMPMKIPIYYEALWGSPYQIIPDSQFIYGPALQGFDTARFLDEHPGWLKYYQEYAFGDNRTGAQIIDYVAQNFSISPRLLLALLEYQAGAMSKPVRPNTAYVLGYDDYAHKGLYLQLVWAANKLNNYYYDYRKGEPAEFDLQDGRLERADPWQNAATVALRHYYADMLPVDQYALATEDPGLAQTWTDLFGDPWINDNPHIPGSLTQPEFRLPFEPGVTWAFTGGPHTGWGNGEPLAAIDFAPGVATGGCTETSEWATAVADGVVVRDGDGIAVLDLDGDGDERTGWVIFYLHLAANGRAPVGKTLKAGEPIGHPSCEGGQSTGTHVHIARKYNGEWMIADSIIPFTLEGWVVRSGYQEYLGTLNRFSQTITACTCSDQASQITAGR